MSLATFQENECVCCGSSIPEGRQTCPSCERKAKNRESLLSEISKALDAYEEDNDLPAQFWLNMFYEYLSDIAMKLGKGEL